MKSIKTVVVVGLGYVGLPLALLADKKGYKTTGFDIDTHKIDSLQTGKSYIDDVSVEELEKTGTIFTTDAKVVENADAVIICVPTPVTKNKQPDLTPVKGSLETIAPLLKPHTLVVLESTVNPGVCDEVVIPLLESLTQMKVGKDIYLAHCPERINPGDSKWNVTNINRVIGANSSEELTLAKSLYDSLVDAEIKPMQSLKEAEAVKVVENSFRDINIAFVNELAMSFHKLGINLENVIDGAATKPFSFMPHHPSCGVGGHCIPVDPYYLIEYAHNYGFEHEFLRLARSINDYMPAFTVELLEEALNEIKKPLNGTKVAMLGLSYKANVGDDRESPAYRVKELLEEAGADLVVYDPFITEKSTVKSLQNALKHADAIVVTAKHKAFLEALTVKTLQEADITVLIDGNNGFKDIKDSFAAANIIYKGIGV